MEDKHTTSNQIEKIANEITHYLQQHQFAADTLEGICLWWITKQRIEEDKNRVLAALEYLIQHQQLVCRHLPDGSVLYSGTTNKDPESPDKNH